MLAQLHWLQDPSESSIRQLLAAATPSLTSQEIDSAAAITTSDPEWCTGTATVAGSFVVKFAWSEPAAIRVWREARVLAALTDAAPGLTIPALVGSSRDPVGFVTRRVEGVPLGHEQRPSWRAVGDELAVFLCRLHDPSVLRRVQDEIPDLIAPHPQAATPAIRERLPRYLDPPRTQLVLDWCDWVDATLAAPSPRQVLAHGDLHGYNQLWNPSNWTLQLVTDFEVSGPTDAEYDLRYLPPLQPSLRFVADVADRYEALTGSSLNLSRVMAWHIRTALGDALWRSEAGVPLPGGCTPASYVDDIDHKLAELEAADQKT